MRLGCEKGYCGPYKISRLFWIDGGREVLPEDDVDRAGGNKMRKYLTLYRCNRCKQRE